MTIAIPLKRQDNSPPHEEVDIWCKERNMTAAYAPWHPEPRYTIFETGTLLSKNSFYPSGVVIVEEDGTPVPWSVYSKSKDS